MDPVILEELNTAINSLNRGKALDVYGLSVENVLHGGEQLKLKLLEVINGNFMAGVVPDMTSSWLEQYQTI